MFLSPECYGLSMIRNIREVKECPDCASDNIIHDDERDQVICRDCGLIYEPFAAIEEVEEELPKPRKKPAKAKAKKRKK